MTPLPRPACAPLTIRIDGTGPVALATALWLVRAGIPARQIALPLDQQARSILPPAGPRRALALSDGSRQILGRLIALPPAGRIGTVEIFQAGSNGHARIEAADFDLPALGHVVDWEALIEALHRAAEALPFGHPQDPAFAAPAVLVHAGGLPPPAERSASEFAERDSGQAGLLLEVQTSATADTAFECFCPAGPLALLPAPMPDGSQRYTVVWCDAVARSQARATLSPEALGQALRSELRSALGAREWARHPWLETLQVCTPAVALPLPRISRRQLTAPGQVWIGNAAQALHPVAGQGLNLGLRDGFELARCLGDAWHQPRPDIAAALAAHARGRRADRQLTIGSTDLFAVTFGWPAASRLQSLLLRVLHLSAPLRRPLASALLFGHRAGSR